MSTSDIPLLDLVTPHRELESQLVEVFRKALSAANFIGGSMLEEFESEFARFCDAQHCVGVGSGTDALRFALIAAGVKSGDIVLTVPNTFIATAEAISQAGARPDFVDIDERTYTMDPRKLAEYLETKCWFNPARRETFHCRSGRVVRAIVPVHLFGQTADMDPILHLASKYNLIVIEDACQAHGAEYCSRRDLRWNKAGAMGKAAAFSFYPGKNLGACGEAGAVTTDNAELARTVRMLRDHGQAQKYYHDLEGYNGRLDAIQAGILRVKLNRLKSWNEQRREAAQNYRELLADIPAVTLPYERPTSRPVYHLFVIRVGDREGLRRYLADKGIATGIHYPVPLHLQKPYQALNYGLGSFPIAEQCASSILSLPMYPGITRRDQKRVAEELRNFTASRLAMAS